MKKQIFPNLARATSEPVERRSGKSGGARGPDLTDELRAAIGVYNEHVEKHGVFSDGLRSF
jgi:hypothetical protein